MTALVETIDHGAIRELRMARPPVNALDPALCAELGRAIGEAIAAGASGLVLSGGPKVFSAGLDVPFLVRLGEDRAALRSAWEGFFAVARALVHAPVPVVAALGGHAPAGGCVLALCCDYRVMASGPFSIGLNETQVGLVAPDGIQHLMRRTIGPRQAERLLVAGELVQAGQALAMGLVDELVDIAQVAGRARAWVEQLVALSMDTNNPAYARVLAAKAVIDLTVKTAVADDHVVGRHGVAGGELEQAGADGAVPDAGRRPGGAGAQSVDQTAHLTIRFRDVVRVPFEWNVGIFPHHPHVEGIMQEQIRQNRACHPTLWSSRCTRLNATILHLYRSFQPAFDVEKHP